MSVHYYVDLCPTGQPLDPFVEIFRRIATKVLGAGFRGPKITKFTTPGGRRYWQVYAETDVEDGQ